MVETSKILKVHSKLFSSPRRNFFSLLIWLCKFLYFYAISSLYLTTEFQSKFAISAQNPSHIKTVLVTFRQCRRSTGPPFWTAMLGEQDSLFSGRICQRCRTAGGNFADSTGLIRQFRWVAIVCCLLSV